jgi:hypothetical protein
MTNKAALELSTLRWRDKTKAERSAHGRLMAQARWGTKPHKRKRAVLRESLTRAGKEIPQSWLDSFVAREVKRTGCSASEAKEKGIRYWEED